MLMTAAVHMDFTSPPPPWFPVPADNHRLPYDFTASAPSPTPATATATATATAATPNHQHHLRPARRVAKRRPRPSRKLPTTYITADPASFRRMVHQVTGADDLPVPPSPPPAPQETLCRPAPYRTSGAMMLPTLDTSAFLLGAPGVPAQTDTPCAGPTASAAASALLDRRTEAGGACNYSSNSNSNSGSSCGGGFPTLDSWDALL